MKHIGTFHSDPKEWARLHLLAELQELEEIGHACNVMEWKREGVMQRPALNRKRQAEAKKLLKLAIAVVRAAP